MDGAAAHVVTFGTVAAIEGARARVVLDMAEDGSGFAGPVPPQIGQVVRVDVGEARVFGIIIGLRTPAAEQAIIGPPNQIMDLDLIGEILETRRQRPVPPRRLRIPAPGRPRVGRRQRRSAQDLHPHRPRGRARRLRAPGPVAACQHLHRRPAGQAFRRARHHRLGQVLRPRRDRARHPQQASSTATSSSSIRTTSMARRSASWRTSSARQNLELPVLAAQLRRDEGADHRRIEPHAGNRRLDPELRDRRGEEEAGRRPGITPSPSTRRCPIACPT